MKGVLSTLYLTLPWIGFSGKGSVNRLRRSAGWPAKSLGVWYKARATQYGISPIPNVTAMGLGIRESKLEELFTAEEVAKKLKVTPSAIFKWAKKGIIPSYRIHEKCLRFKERDIGAFIERGRGVGFSNRIKKG